jgi:hypothetical protein
MGHPGNGHRCFADYSYISRYPAKLRWRAWRIEGISNQGIETITAFRM